MACRHCGALARTILVPRAKGSFLSLLPGAFAYPFSASGLMTLLGAGLVFSLVERAGCLASLLVTGFIYALMFQVIRTTALGEEDLPIGGESDPWAAVGALLKGVCAVVVALLPSVFYVALRYETGALLETEQPLAAVALDPFLFLSLALGALWGTAALVFAATHSPFTSIVNPLSAIRLVRLAGSDFVVATVLFWLLVGAEQYVKAISGGFEEMVPVPVAARAFARAMTLYLPLVSARMLGLFLLVRGAQLGYGAAEDALQPALGDTGPEPDVPPAPMAAEPPRGPAAEITLPPPEVPGQLPRLSDLRPPSPEALAPVAHEPLDVDVSDQAMRLDDFQPIAATVVDPGDFGGEAEDLEETHRSPLELDLPSLPPVPEPGGSANDRWSELDAAWPEPSSAPTEVLSHAELDLALSQQRKPPQSS